jgi:hypothetical protein
MRRPLLLVTALAACAVVVLHHRHTPARPAATRLVSPPARNPKPTSSAAPAAAAFARAYVRFLDGHRATAPLPRASARIRRLAAEAGPIPTATRSGRLTITKVTVQQATGSTRAQAVVTARNRRHGLSFEVSLAYRASRWVVVSLLLPDPDTILAPLAAPIARATPPGRPPQAARSAASRFLRSYLRFTYGHVQARRLRDVTAWVRRRLAANPPRVPRAVRALRPIVRSLALERRGSGWTAVAAVADGRSTYVVVFDLTNKAGTWAVSSIHPPA